MSRRARRLASELREHTDRMQEYAETGDREAEAAARRSLKKTTDPAFKRAMEQRIGPLIDERDAGREEDKRNRVTIERVEDNG